MRSPHKLRFLSLLTVTALLAGVFSPAAAAQGGLLNGFQGTQFIFSDREIRVVEGSGTNYTIDGTALSITGPGSYAVSGKCSDGSITVKKGVTDAQITLSGLDLTSASTAPIVCAKGSHVTLYVAGGTENTLTDAAINNDETHPENTDAENAVIKCKDGSQVTIAGTGTLNIIANGKNGIKSGMTTDGEGEAWMEISSLTLNITATVNDAINAEQKLNIMSGNLIISAADDAIHSDRALNIGALGTDGPTIAVSKCIEGLEGADLAIYSGDITIQAEDDGLNAANSDLANYPFTLTIAGGRLLIDTTTGDGIDSNGTLTISGGDIQIHGTSNGDNAPLDSDGSFTVTGGTVLAVGSGGMAQEPIQNQAFVSFGGGFGGGFRGGLGDGDRRDPNAEGETGFRFRPEKDTIPTDPNAPKPMSGGSQALPAGLNGQVSASPVSMAAGDEFTIRDQSGKILASGTARRAAGYVFFSSAILTAGESYQLYINGTKTADATAATQGTSRGSGMKNRSNFQDVAQTDWFYEAVDFVRSRDLMTGVSDTAFQPQGSTTRSMIWTVLARLNGVDTTGGSTWYEKGQAWAVANNISDGSAPDQMISREELFTMLYRYAQAFGSAIVADQDYILNYPDASSLHSWAVNAAKWMTKNSVVDGKDGLLLPGGTATRAEVATILQRYSQLQLT